MKFNTLQQLISNMSAIEREGVSREELDPIWDMLWEIYALMNKVREAQMKKFYLNKNDPTS